MQWFPLIPHVINHWCGSKLLTLLFWMIFCVDYFFLCFFINLFHFDLKLVWLLAISFCLALAVIDIHMPSINWRNAQFLTQLYVSTLNRTVYFHPKTAVLAKIYWQMKLTSSIRIITFIAMALHSNYTIGSYRVAWRKSGGDMNE